MALKLLELKFLFILSNNLFPLNSILIKYKPIAPNISGAIKLIFSGKKISLGYFTNYEDIINSVDKFKGVLITGDIGFLDEDNCITITGRESRFAKIDGHRIALDELEMKISEESENFAIVSNDEFLFIALPKVFNSVHLSSCI